MFDANRFERIKREAILRAKMRKREFCENEYFFVTGWQKCNYAGRKTEIIICNFFTAMKSTYYAKNVIFVFIVHRFVVSSLCTISKNRNKRAQFLTIFI